MILNLANSIGIRIEEFFSNYIIPQFSFFVKHDHLFKRLM